MTELVIRPLVAGEEHIFDSLPDPALVGLAAFGRTYAGTAARGEYRPEWTWVALRGDTVVARAAWWGGPKDDKPVTLDWFDFAEGEAAAGVELLYAAPLHADYILALPPGWRDQPEVRAAAEARIEAVTAAGRKPLVERYQYVWTLDCGLPERPGRLEFRPEPDDGVILDVLSRIQHGTLDAHARRTMASGGVDAAAQDELDFLHWLVGPRELWRLAHTPAGELVGLAVPSANYGGPVVGIVGVVPEQRGHGHGYDLLVECTHLLVADGAQQITAATDQTNVPMAAAFAKASYPIVQERLFFS